MNKSTVLLAALCGLCGPLQATVFHIDPQNGSMVNDGSAGSPWSTLAEVLDAELIETRSYDPLPYVAGTSALIPKNPGAPVQAGDTLLLHSGLHGTCFYRGAYNEEMITIIAAPGATPILSWFHFQACANWRLVGVQVSPEPYGTYHGEHLVVFASHGWHGPMRQVEVRECTLFTAADTWTWSAQDWVDRHSDGIRITGNQALVQDNQLTNVHFGIAAAGDSIQAIGNSIVNFSGDGMRPLGNDILFEGNTIKNCYAVDGNHDDGIQSFTSIGNPYYRVTLRGNTIINNEDPDQPLLGSLQGIGCFDGPFIDWVVENNVVVVDHWHGISLYGAQDCLIANNTVIDPTPDVSPGPSWIMINDTDDFPSTGCVVANNLANTFSVTDGTLSSNIELVGLADYAAHFVNAAGYDLHLLATSTAVDSADGAFAPLMDHDGMPRPFGPQSDVGAYEYTGTTSVGAWTMEPVGMYPNPAQDQVFLRNMQPVAPKEIEVLDPLGRVVLRDRNTDVLDVRVLAPGAYSVRGDGVWYGRFLKR